MECVALTLGFVIFMAENFNIILQELVRRSNEETRRLRTIEQRLDAVEDKLNTLVDNTSDRSKRAHTRIADMEVNVKNVSDEIVNIKMSVERITKQLSKFAQHRDLKEIEKMLELLSPVNRLEPEPKEIHVNVKG